MASAFLQVMIMLAVLGAVLLGLYALTQYLPGAWRERGQVLIFAGPAVFLVFAGLFVPAVRTIWVSFHDDGGKNWVGLDNYDEIFSGRDTRLVLFNTFTWVVGGTLFVVIVALAVARFADGMRGEKVAKSLIFIPAAIALAGAGIIWKFIYAGPPFEVGLANQAAKAIPGLPASLGGDGDKIWLVDRNIGALNPPSSAPGMNTFLLVVIFIWAATGLATVIFSAAIKGVPEVLIEAARVDGRDQAPDLLQGDPAVHHRHRRHRRHHHGDRRPQGVRHRGRDDRRQLRHEHDRQRVLPDLLRAEPQRLRIGLRRALVLVGDPGRRHEPTCAATGGGAVMSIGNPDRQPERQLERGRRAGRGHHHRVRGAAGRHDGKGGDGR